MASHSDHYQKFVENNQINRWYEITFGALSGECVVSRLHKVLSNHIFMNTYLYKSLFLSTRTQIVQFQCSQFSRSLLCWGIWLPLVYSAVLSRVCLPLWGHDALEHQMFTKGSSVMTIKPKTTNTENIFTISHSKEEPGCKEIRATCEVDTSFRNWRRYEPASSDSLVLIAWAISTGRLLWIIRKLRCWVAKLLGFIVELTHGRNKERKKGKARSWNKPWKVLSTSTTL